MLISINYDSSSDIYTNIYISSFVFHYLFIAIMCLSKYFLDNRC